MANRVRSETLSLRMMPEEKEIIKQKMKETQAKNYVDFIMKAVCTHKTVVVNIDTRPLMNIGGELNSIGVNLNQLTKAVNTAKKLSDTSAEELKTYLDEMNNNIEEMREVVRKCLDIFIDAREGRISGLYEDTSHKK